MDNDAKSLTKQQWVEVEKCATSLFGKQVDLLIDGFKVSLEMEPKDRYHNVIMVYINDIIDGKKLMEDCEERRRFWCPHTRSLIPVKPEKGWKKAEWEALRKKHSYTYYLPWWTSFNALRRHLIKNNQSIEIIN